MHRRQNLALTMSTWLSLEGSFELIFIDKVEGGRGSIIRIVEAGPSVCQLRICLIEYHPKLVLTRTNDVTFFLVHCDSFFPGST